MYVSFLHNVFSHLLHTIIHVAAVRLNVYTKTTPHHTFTFLFLDVYTKPVITNSGYKMPS